MHRRSAAALACLLTASLACAAAQETTPNDAAQQADAGPPETLRIGDKARDLAPEILWMRNLLVPEWKDDTVYVLYLWSPDSPASMGSFPQVHGIDQRFRSEGVVTVSVAIDMQPGGFEPIDVVRSRAEFMAHTVAEDRGEFIKQHWYEPTGYDTLPVVFVINTDGVIAFMDNSLAQVSLVLREVLAGEWDIEAAQNEFDRIRELEQDVQPLVNEATAAARRGDWGQVVQYAEELLEADKEHFYKMAMTKFVLLLTKLNKPGDAYEWGYKIVDDHIANDSGMLVTMAETIVSASGVPFRDYNLARKAAERADKLTDGKLAQVKNALAASWMGLGESGRAIEQQMEAVRLAPTKDARDQYQATLDRYLNQVPSN